MNPLSGPNNNQQAKHRANLKKLWNTAKWPYLPSPESDLYVPACDLMERDTYLAGCFQRIIDSGDLPNEYHHLLYIDENLTLRLSNSQDDRKNEFLSYKAILDACIEEALMVLCVPKTTK